LYSENWQRPVQKNSILILTKTIIIMPKIRVSDKELDTPEMKAAFIKLFGAQQYIKTVQQFAKQRIEPATVGGGIPNNDDAIRKALDSLPEKEAEELNKRIIADLALPDKKKPVFAEVSISEMALLGHSGQQLFLDTFGYERFMQAHELQGLEELDDRAYHQIQGRTYQPYTRSTAENPE
jgi:hypothetical protein